MNLVVQGIVVEVFAPSKQPRTRAVLDNLRYLSVATQMLPSSRYRMK